MYNVLYAKPRILRIWLHPQYLWHIHPPNGQKCPALLFIVTTSPNWDWVICAPAAFLGYVAESICELLPKHQAFIRNLKSSGFTVVGYARKSLGTEDIATRLRLLQKMVDRLFKVSLTDKAFVSYSTNAADPITSRDSHTESEHILQMHNVEGNTQAKQWLSEASLFNMPHVRSGGASSSASYQARKPSDTYERRKKIQFGGVNVVNIQHQQLALQLIYIQRIFRTRKSSDICTPMVEDLTQYYTGLDSWMDLLKHADTIKCGLKAMGLPLCPSGIKRSRKSDDRAQPYPSIIEICDTSIELVFAP
ncbi:hypothetical protein BCR42DRAFT_454040 [Absidia repens]|uniref:Uncharacterized protein n=1 Tax=Absidia repens TaxID=90262 RepID=A0A1X2I899_9FUNG|nr:hypothetical protein BCR42DRAFT_454040 [Absidia repens]